MTSRRNRTSQNRVGQRFGNLLVIAEGERIRYPGDPEHGRRTAECQCDCGAIVNVRMDFLTTGKKKKCSRYCECKPPTNLPTVSTTPRSSNYKPKPRATNNLIVKIIKIIKNFIIKLLKR